MKYEYKFKRNIGKIPMKYEYKSNRNRGKIQMKYEYIISRNIGKIQMKNRQPFFAFHKFLRNISQYVVICGVCDL